MDRRAVAQLMLARCRSAALPDPGELSRFPNGYRVIDANGVVLMAQSPFHAAKNGSSSDPA
jgi:hypothetical protein